MAAPLPLRSSAFLQHLSVDALQQEKVSQDQMKKRKDNDLAEILYSAQRCSEIFLLFDRPSRWYLVKASTNPGSSAEAKSSKINKQYWHCQESSTPLLMDRSMLIISSRVAVVGHGVELASVRATAPELAGDLKRKGCRSLLGWGIINLNTEITEIINNKVG